MALIKKASVDKVVRNIKTTSGWIKPRINGEYIMDDEEIDLKAVKGNSRVSFVAEIKQFPFSCSAYDLGNFSIITSKVDVDNKILKGLIKDSLTELIEYNTNFYIPARCHTIMFTLNGNPACKMIKEVLQGTNLFTLVKTFVNDGTGAIIELYVSNN